MKATLIVGLVLAAARLSAQDSLSVAKDLYASAAYEDALTALSRLDSARPDVARQVDEYRAFCLFALGRTPEAESIAESIIRKEPLARLDAADASPRVEAMFTAVRKRLLPSLIRDRYRVAKSALDQKRFADAEPPLAEASIMMVEAEKIGVVDAGLGDLSILVDGFLQLIRSTAEQRTSQPPVEAAVSAPGPVSASRAPAGADRSTAPPPSATPAAASGPRVYSVADEGVTPPVTISQDMPVMSREMLTIAKAMKVPGLVDVRIDETGHVADATVRQSLNLSFDTVFVRAARNWRYQPAMKDGVAVQYLKTLVVVP